MSPRHQTIFRNGSPTNPYAQILNACLQDDDLGDGPGWVLMLCLSLPKDWRVSLEWVARKRGYHVTTVRKHVRHLEKLGYCRRDRVRNSDGTLGPYEFAFTDQRGTFGSDVEPAMQKPAMAEPAMVKLPPTKKETNQHTKQQNKGSIQLKGKRIEFCDDLVGEAERVPRAQQELDPGEWVDALDAEGEARLIAEAREAAAAARPKPVPASPSVGARLNRLPILPEVLAKLSLMGLDVAALVKEFERETAAKHIDNPTGYLMGMARRRVAQREGIPVEAVDAMYSKDPRVKGEAMAALVGAKVERRWKGARHRATAGHGPQHVGSHLIAALENRGLTA